MNIRSIADKTGIIGSFVCAIHCLAGPIILVMLPVFPLLWAPDESFHQLMLWILVPTGLIAFSLGYRKHKHIGTLMLGMARLLGLLLAATIFQDALGENGERILTVAAAATLVLAHFRNFRFGQIADSIPNSRSE